MNLNRARLVFLTAGAAAGLLTAAVCLASPTREPDAQPPPEVVERVGGLLGLVCDRLWVETDRFWHEGEYRRCIAVTWMITEIDPQDTEAFSTGAWLLWNVGEGEEAIAFYEKGISLNLGDPQLYFDLGMHYYNLKRYEDAVTALERARDLKPPALHWRLLAHAYERGGRLRESISTWEHVKELTPEDPVVDRNLARVKKKAEGVRSPE